MSVKRLLLCSAVWLDRTGAENNRLNRMRAALHQHGVETFLTGFGPGSQPQGWELRKDAFGATVPYRFPWSRWAYPSPAMRRLSSASRFHAQYGDALIRALKPDGLLVYTDEAALCRSVLALGRGHGLPAVADAAEYHRISLHYLLNGVNIQQWLFRHRLVPRLDGLVGVGPAWCEWASRKGVPSVWIPAFSVRPTVTRVAPASDSGAMHLVFIGHWVARECPRLLVEGLARAIDQGVSLKISVLGHTKGNYRERRGLKCLKQFPRVEQATHFQGYVDDVERDILLASADFFVVLRKPDKESEHLFPSRIPEYLESANPIILSGPKKFLSCFDHGKSAWILPREPTANDLAEAIVTLAKDPRLRFKIGLGGRRLGEMLFSPEKLAKDLVNFLDIIKS